jgi:hypothetical protein
MPAGVHIVMAIVHPLLHLLKEGVIHAVRAVKERRQKR